MSTPTNTELLNPRHISALRDLLAAYCGVYLDETRKSALEAATQRRAQALGQTPAAYVTGLGLSIDRAELQRLAELLLNHETQFFRNRPHMHALRTVVLPELHQRLPPGAPLRLWSAGCATGEEPYSLAIAALEAFGDHLDRPVEVWATDLSSTALERARTGVYKGRSLANLNSQQRARYFTARGAELVVAPRVRELVHFEQLNLLEPFPTRARGVHIIFCQNVTIYFQVQTCRLLMERFYQNMDEGGALFLGFSETLWNIFDRFRGREVAGAFIYCKASIGPVRATVPLVPKPTPALPAPRMPSPPRPPAQPAASTTPRPPRPPSISNHPTGSAIVSQGQALLDAGQADAALALFYSAPLVGAQAPQILALAARAHADRGDLDLAAAEARRALELNPLTTEAHLLIGLIHARQGRHAAAITQLERARTIDGESPVILFHLAECYRQLGRASEALRDYRTTMRKLATHPPDKLIDGVAAGWLSETCRRYVAMISGEGL
ncbi:MAG: tetratricopeptide repeat protein [Candidatus Viridilinea halotolerans]|uniref:Tetratricopeptide repeat protein n=1 Tax=Candidatus Viridilinea halotolerans TaxID=2491704 RepID=A0A426TQJ6_9CHLR|nr:MAG: tetratricopeptide repeat protein [Candidatus Viridilinea halotolerans]